MANVLEIKNACLSFGERLIWNDLNLNVAEGEFIAVIGANGSGKSMLLKSILGQQDLTSGSVKFWENRPVTAIPRLATFPSTGWWTPVCR
jgi:zinc/manganese transport system ATP-binding protein